MRSPCPANPAKKSETPPSSSRPCFNASSPQTEDLLGYVKLWTLNSLPSRLVSEPRLRNVGRATAGCSRILPDVGFGGQHPFCQFQQLPQGWIGVRIHHIALDVTVLAERSRDLKEIGPTEI